MGNRYEWVDYAKSIGIILVVYGHVARGLHNAGIEISESLYSLCDSIVYSFHMPLFFFLSGLFFYSSFLKRGAKQLILIKIDSIIYPYILWSLFQGFIEYFLSKYTNGNILISEILSLLWRPRAQFWFLYALFFIFLTTTLLYILISNKSQYKDSFCIILLIISSFLYVFPSTESNFIIFKYIGNYLVFFFLGIVFSNFKLNSYLSDKWSLLITVITFVSSQWFFHGYLSLRYSNKGIISLLLALISIFFIVSLSNFLSIYKLNKLKILGYSSMAIYLMHILAASGVRIVLQKFAGVDSYFIHLIIGSFSGIFIPVIISSIIRKYKIQNIFSARISYYYNSLFAKLYKRKKI